MSIPYWGRLQGLRFKDNAICLFKYWKLAVYRITVGQVVQFFIYCDIFGQIEECPQCPLKIILL